MKDVRTPEALALGSYIIIVGAMFFALEDPILASTENFGQGIISIAYLLGDALLLSLSLPLVYGAATGRVGDEWVALCLALALIGVADIAFFALTSAGAYTTAHPMNILYVLGYLWAGMSIPAIRQ
jgi:hypothetical protein